MSSADKSFDSSLEKVYAEASQWVRLANTVFWTVGALLVPISFGFVGLALNRSSGMQFTPPGKIILGIGSVSLFSFWIYASSLYRVTSFKARVVLINIEDKWLMPDKMAFYRDQGLIGHPLYYLQMAALGLLIAVWLSIVIYEL